MAAVLGTEYGQPTPRRQPRQFNGMTPVEGPSRAKTQDSVILEIRRLKEQCQMMPAAIVEHLAGLDIAVDRVSVIRVLSYATRGHLVPDDGAPPYITTKNQ
jgi:hypothetical protein